MSAVVLRVLKVIDRDRKQRVVKCAPALAATIVIVLSFTTSAIGQERPHWGRITTEHITDSLHSFAPKGQLSNSEHLALLTFLHKYNQTCVARWFLIERNILREALSQLNDCNFVELSRYRHVCQLVPSIFARKNLRLRAIQSNCGVYVRLADTKRRLELSRFHMRLQDL